LHTVDLTTTVSVYPTVTYPIRSSSLYPSAHFDYRCFTCPGRSKCSFRTRSGPKLLTGFHTPVEELENDPGLHAVQAEDSATIVAG
jgi:hypothetical protein